MNRVLNAATAVVLFSLLPIGTPDAPRAAPKDGESVSIGEYRVIHSEVLNEDRTLLVHLPRGYEAGGLGYPVLYLLYADQVAGYFAESVHLLDRLSGASEMPQVLLIGVANTDRYRDLLPVLSEGRPGGTDNFLRFFAEELVPFVEKNYRTKQYRIVMGPQAGATFALYALLERPDLFDAAIVNNPFGAPGSREFLVQKAQRFFEEALSFNKFLFVTFREDEQYAAKDLEYLYRFSHLIQSRKPQGFNLDLNFLTASDEFITPTGLKEGLRALFPGYMLPVDGAVQGLNDIKEYYDNLSRRYGYAMDIPDFVLTLQSDDLMARGKVEESVEVLEYLIKEYPGSVDGYWRLANYHRERGNKNLAIRYYRKCVELHPDIAPARQWLERLEAEKE